MEDDAGDATANAPFDDNDRRSELERASSDIDTCEDPVGHDNNVHDDALLSLSDFSRENGGSSRVQLSFDGVPTSHNESIHAPLATLPRVSDASSMGLSSLASASNHSLSASNAACPPFRHPHQSSVLREVDAAEPSLGDSGLLPEDAPGIQPDDARSAQSAGQTKSAFALAQFDVEGDKEERHHTTRSGTNRRDDGMSSTSHFGLFGFRTFPDYHNKGDDGEVGGVHSMHGSMPTPQSIYNEDPGRTWT